MRERLLEGKICVMGLRLWSMSDSIDRWPPPPPASGRRGAAPRRRFRPPERHAHWVDRDHVEDEPREDAPNLLWWVLGALLAFAVLSVMIRMFLVT